MCWMWIERETVSDEADETSTKCAWIHMRDGIAVARNKYCHWQIIFTICCGTFSALPFVFSRERVSFFAFCFSQNSTNLGLTPTIKNYYYYYLSFGRFSLNDFSFWRNKIHRRRPVGTPLLMQTGRGTSTCSNLF